jgi:hypothetical protein
MGEINNFITLIDWRDKNKTNGLKSGQFFHA